MFGKRIVLTVHNVRPHEKDPVKMFLNKSVFSLGDEYIVHTPQNKQELQKFVGRKKIHIIPHGVMTSVPKTLTREAARQKLDIKESDRILLCFGHIRPYKGLDIALEALSLIKNESVKLLIAGKCWEDWARYQKIIDDRGLAHRVILRLDLVPESEMEMIFRASDLLLLPYKHFDAQSGPGALVVAYEIPMVVSNTGGLTDYVSDEHCIVTPNDAGQLAAKIQQIMGDSSLYNKLISDIKKTREQFGWSSIAQKTIVVYEQNLSQ